MRSVQSLALAMVLAMLPTAVSAQVELPQIPEPVPVELPAATTAFLVLDMQQSNCARRPACMESLPAMGAFLERVREAGVMVVYTGNPAGIMPEVAQREDDPFPVTSGGNKFFNSELDQILKDAGITTLLIVGTSAVNAVVNTSFAATQLSYTVAVAEDGISADNDFQVFYARYHLLLQNLQNVPLVPRAATLTRTDLVTFLAE